MKYAPERHTNKWKSPTIVNPVIPKRHESIARPPSRAMLEGEVKKWNDTFLAGHKVEVTLDSGKILETRTRSSAWLLGGHTPVVMVDGLSGAFLLSRCRGVERFGSEIQFERDQSSDLL